MTMMLVTGGFLVDRSPHKLTPWTDTCCVDKKEEMPTSRLSSRTNEANRILFIVALLRDSLLAEEVLGARIRESGR
jgi:hypothetical protein